ncbi:hypothetical protein pdam_00008279 [Pocillopora damicornis]|uniref:Uncharacterized protein n=1 Tax=Pocillopora damicornis TaxID=46731 RepID=A0A3M6U5T9_POCDA|nr:hypothetical protein pdam_00008279 [Pocillopora damicornis]
MEQFCYHT